MRSSSTFICWKIFMCLVCLLVMQSIQRLWFHNSLSIAFIEMSIIFQVSKPLKLKASLLLLRALRVAFAVFILRISFYIYYNAIITAPFEHISTPLLCYSHYAAGFCFYLQYVFCFGLSNILSAFVGIETPEWPRCIALNYTYTELFR